MSTVLPILLAVGCLAFLILEVFLVSFGTLSVVAIGCGIAGVMLAFQVDQVFGWSMVGSLVVGAPLVLWAAFRLLPKLGFARGLYLKAPDLSEAERTAAAKPATALMGAIGEATSPLRPSGTAVFDGEPCQVVTQGRMLPPGTKIKVVDVTGNRVIVEELE